MHIVYVPDSFPQPSETFVINEIDGLLNKGFHVSVVPRISGNIEQTQHTRLQTILPLINVVYSKRGFDVRAFFLGLKYGSQVRLGWRPHNVVKHIKNAISISRHVVAIKRQKPDLILIHFGYDNAIAGSIAAKILNKPSILWLHGSDIHTVPHRKLKWLTDHVSEVITHSVYAECLLKQQGITKRINIFCLGVNTGKFKVQNNNRLERPTLICIARMGHGKSQSSLIYIFKKLKERVSNADLWLVGDGPYIYKYKELVSRIRVEDVKFWGALSQEKIVQLLNQAWVKVLISEKEGFPVVLMEAQASGLPCVASSVGGIAEVVNDEETGFLFDLDDADFDGKVEDAMVDLLTNQELRESMGNKARTRAMELFDENLHIERMDKLIKQLLRKN